MAACPMNRTGDECLLRRATLVASHTISAIQGWVKKNCCAAVQDAGRVQQRGRLRAGPQARSRHCHRIIKAAFDAVAEPARHHQLRVRNPLRCDCRRQQDDL